MKTFTQILGFGMAIIFSTSALAEGFGALDTSDTATLELGDAQSMDMVFTAADDFRGKVSFAIDRSSLVEVEGAEDVAISLSASEILVSPGAIVNLTVNMQSRLSAPSFSGKTIQVIATAHDGSVMSTQWMLDIVPKVEIKMFKCEYQNKNKLDECWNRPAVMELRPHISEISLSFINCDVDLAHTIHGNNPIQHGNTGSPLAKAKSVDECGGAYLTTVDGTVEGEGSYYMHDTQGGAFARYINFGVISPSL